MAFPFRETWLLLVRAVLQAPMCIPTAPSLSAAGSPCCSYTLHTAGRPPCAILPSLTSVTAKPLLASHFPKIFLRFSGSPGKSSPGKKPSEFIWKSDKEADSETDSKRQTRDRLKMDFEVPLSQ